MGIELKGPTLFLLRLSAWVPVLSPWLHLSRASYRLMGNCCGGTATVPSEPAPTQVPLVTQRTTPAPVPSQNDVDRPPVSSLQQPRTRGRTTYKPESTHRSRMSSQDLNLRSRTKSAPQRPQSSKSSLTSQAETLSAPKRSSRSDSRPTSPGERDR